MRLVGLEDDLQPVEDDVQTTYTLRMMTLIYIYNGRLPKFVISFKLTRAI